MSELFKIKKLPTVSDYNSSDIEVLEGLEPVRKRPGMYIGGTDEGALHHLVNEVFDNSMDEAVAGFASKIEISLEADGSVRISDNGRGIPVDNHPKFPDKSALEVILTILHSGGKFTDKVYNTSGGLHGVGLSVVNALSDKLEVQVIREKKLYKQIYSKGIPLTKLECIGDINSKNGTIILFHPDKEIFGNLSFKPEKLYHLAKSKAYLYKGIEIVWSCDPVFFTESANYPQKEVLRFPQGIVDFLSSQIKDRDLIIEKSFVGYVEDTQTSSKFEWAIAWTEDEDAEISYYCNTIRTKDGGAHEVGFRNILLKGLKSFGEMVGNKKTSLISSEEILNGCVGTLSIFIKNPHFQGQTKDKLVSTDVTKLVEQNLKDYFDHWLIDNKKEVEILLNHMIEKSEERLRRKSNKDTARKTILHKIRLPGKLADCSMQGAKNTELFIVEGDSAGGSAKQARIRETQAVLPMRGKILNVASSNNDKILSNQELSDLELALGCGTLNHYNEGRLRYDKVVIMTDADVDGAHIASLLMTYFFIKMQDLIRNGHLYLAKPPLYRLTVKDKTFYAVNDHEKEKLLKLLSSKGAKVEIGRFKGLGEMTAKQLKETTMNPGTRTLLKVLLPANIDSSTIKVEQLMGKRPELRFNFIQEETMKYGETVLDKLDI
jgi:topoisomerase IV subunit B